MGFLRVFVIFLFVAALWRDITGPIRNHMQVGACKVFKFVSKVLAVAAFAFSVGSANAASLSPVGPYFSLGTCSTGDVSGGATECYGGVASSDAFVVDVNNGSFSGAQGLFGITNWLDIYSSNTAGADFEQVAGNFTTNWDLRGPVAVLLRMPGSWAAYLFDSLSAGVYAFDLSGVGSRSLEGIRIISTNPIPVPAALPLLAGGLGAMVMVGRRRRKAATA